MKTTRLAAVDVGTNSIRCIVVEAPVNGHFRVLDDEKATVRLGEGLHATGRISDAAIERAREALVRMRKIAAGLGAEDLDAVATSAVRRAGNGSAFVTQMARDTGVRIRVIDGEEEAELAALSARRHFDMGSNPYAMLDLGGGSAEIVTAVGDHVEGVHSLDLGTVYLTERYLHRDPVGDRELARLQKHIRKELRRSLGDVAGPPVCLIGSGGTVTTIGNVLQGVRKERYESVHGYEVLRSDVVHLLAMLQHRSLRERQAVAGLSPERADIIVAGVAVVDRVMSHLGVNVLRINERGIREGLILKALRERGVLREGGDGSDARDWRASVLTLARSCHVDEAHARQVARLALALFDALAEPAGLGPRARTLLEAAALLHDVGYFIGYAKHHKHSHHLIRHAPLFDFSPREKEVVASVARYHRKALPKKGHEGYGQLPAEDQDLVRKLGGLLRLADGLDRRRSSSVAELQCHLDGDECRVVVTGAEDLSVELYGGQAKGDLFEAAFGRRLLLEQRGAPGAAAGRGT